MGGSWQWLLWDILCSREDLGTGLHTCNLGIGLHNCDWHHCKELNMSVDFSLFPKDSHFNVFFIMSFKMHTLIDMHCTGEPAYMT